MSQFSVVDRDFLELNGIILGLSRRPDGLYLVKYSWEGTDYKKFSTNSIAGAEITIFTTADLMSIDSYVAIDRSIPRPASRFGTYRVEDVLMQLLRDQSK